jgi:solute carrier family 35, member E3
MFQAKRVNTVQILPLAFGMIFNVVLTNTSLAYSSIQFYQVSRVFMTPAVALLNYMISRATIPSLAGAALVPVCLGVAIVSYFDTKPAAGARAAATSPVGVVFAFAGVLASSIYTVCIKKYHGVLQCSSMQLLFNQAPVSVVLMLYIVPFSDDVTAWEAITGPLWLLICLVSPIRLEALMESDTN